MVKMAKASHPPPATFLGGPISMRGLESFAHFGDGDAAGLSVNPRVLDEAGHGIGQSVGVSGAVPGLVLRIGYLA